MYCDGDDRPLTLSSFLNFAIEACCIASVQRPWRGELAAQVKEPDGSLNRAASTAVQMATERRETRDAMQQSLLNSIPKDMNRPWEDPRPEPGERALARDSAGVQP